MVSKLLLQFGGLYTKVPTVIISRRGIIILAFSTCYTSVKFAIFRIYALLWKQVAKTHNVK